MCVRTSCSPCCLRMCVFLICFIFIRIGRLLIVRLMLLVMIINFRLCRIDFIIIMCIGLLRICLMIMIRFIRLSMFLRRVRLSLLYRIRILIIIVIMSRVMFRLSLMCPLLSILIIRGCLIIILLIIVLRCGSYDVS